MGDRKELTQITKPRLNKAMTRDQFTKQLPPFADDDLGVKPPLMFEGVSARFFPLRANLDTLQQVCNGYLNIVPPEAGYFRVPLPFAFLVVLDYGQMGESVMRTGWFSQVEVYFGVPVEWYKLRGGRWVFHDWAVITPYIFVNDDVSVPVGRTVYGFPKVLAQVNQVDSGWIKNPTSPITLASIATTVFPEAYSGGDLETRVFLEIERAAMSNLQVPFDAESPMMPWKIASNLATALGGFGKDAYWLSQAMRISPINPFADPGVIQEMAGRMPPWFAPGGPGFILNSLNLKQFRHSEDPSKICYQSLTNGCMRTTGVRGAGLLGEGAIILGDLSGGHSIRLSEDSTLPIARTLGLEANRSWSVNGVKVSEFKPVMPCWVNVDLNYSQGTNVAWRADNGIWKDEAGTAFDATQRPAPLGKGPPYNNTVSTAIEAISGPFQFTGTTIRVIPLLAEKSKLTDFLDSAMNKPLQSPIVHADGSKKEHVRFEVWSRPPQAVNEGSPVGGHCAYVYLVASSFSSVVSKTNNVGDWAKYQLEFMVPVKWQRMRDAEWDRKGPDGKPVKENGNWETMGVGLVPAFTFADNCITAMSLMEIQGIAAGTATFVRPESVWLGEEGETDPTQTLLRVNVEVLTALGAGQKAAQQPVIEISRDDPNAGLGTAPDTAWKWAEALRLELGTKKGTKQQYFEELKIARALALEVLGNQTPVSVYTLKQFRDVTDPDKACYQSVVRVPRVLSEVSDVREIEETLAVRIFDYPDLHIVETLGLLPRARIEESAAGIVYSLQGIRPFYVRATVDEPLAQRLLSRAGTKTWTIYPAAFQTLLSDEKGAPKIQVDMKAETLQDQMDPSRTSETMYQARQRLESGDAPGVITPKMARNAFAYADAQIVIESVLSREWSNFDPNARWRKGRQALRQGFSALPEGGPTKPYAEAELYRRINNLLAAPPGAVAAMISLENMRAPGQNSPVSEAMQTLAANALGRKLTSADLAALTVIEENLHGQGAARRWREELIEIIKNQSLFTAQRLTLEHSVDMLSASAILGVKGLKEAYEAINQKLPPGQRLHVPDAAELYADAKNLFSAMAAIQKMPVEGEPSPHNNLDTTALADEIRLGEMLAVLGEEFKDDAGSDDSVAAKLEAGRAHSTEEGEMVTLARRKCEVQYEALVNKLSRAYQKPDFCIRRDAFAAGQRDGLVPMTLSWDENWYYGDKIRLSDALALPLLKQTNALGETLVDPE
jgi:hypothetical protein